MTPDNLALLEDQILSLIGLKRKISDRDAKECHYLTGPDFLSYVRNTYATSPEYSMDEVYRMYETVRVHLPTGLRFYCLSHESFFGDAVSYTLFQLHVITTDGKVLDISSLDLQKRVVMTSGGPISLDSLSREPE